MSDSVLEADEQVRLVRGEVLPWMQDSFEQLVDIFNSKKMPHALMLSGPEFLGKSRFATKLVRLLLCERSRESAAHEACMQCQSCLLAEARSHPDLLVLDADGGTSIKVDAVRALSDRLLQTAHQGYNKICRINRVELLTHSAANALLKILEEPPENTYFVLVTHQLTQIAPTILSRCQRIDFAIPAKRMLVDWLAPSYDQGDIDAVLEQTRNLPLKALAVLNQEANLNAYESKIDHFMNAKISASDLAAEIEAGEQPFFLDAMYQFVARICRQDDAAAANLPHQPSSLDSGLSVLRLISEAKIALGRNANANLTIESLLIKVANQRDKVKP